MGLHNILMYISYIQWNINKSNFIYTIEYYSAIKKNERLLSAATWWPRECHAE